MTEIKAPQPAPAPPSGGPAFPMPSYLAELGTVALEAAGASERVAEQFAEKACGMSLRDYFAAKAMAAILAQPDNCADVPPRIISESAYRQADEMLKARGGAA